MSICYSDIWVGGGVDQGWVGTVLPKVLLRWMLGIGCLGELSAGFSNACTFVARSHVVSYLDRYDDKSPKEALGIFRSRTRRVWGHVAVFAWSDLAVDCSRKLVGLQSPVGGIITEPTSAPSNGTQETNA